MIHVSHMCTCSSHTVSLLFPTGHCTSGWTAAVLQELGWTTGTSLRIPWSLSLCGQCTMTLSSGQTLKPMTQTGRGFYLVHSAICFVLVLFATLCYALSFWIFQAKLTVKAIYVLMWLPGQFDQMDGNTRSPPIPVPIFGKKRCLVGSGVGVDFFIIINTYVWWTIENTFSALINSNTIIRLNMPR